MKDALSGLEEPAIADEGDRIEMVLAPGYSMTVLSVKPCESGSDNRSGPHSQFRIIDPEGNADWLCAWDCVKIS